MRKTEAENGLYNPAQPTEDKGPNRPSESGLLLSPCSGLTYVPQKEPCEKHTSKAR